MRRYSLPLVLGALLALFTCSSAFAQSANTPAQDVYNPDGNVLDFVATATPTPATNVCDDSSNGSGSNGSGANGCGEVESNTSECGDGSNGSGTSGSGANGSGENCGTTTTVPSSSDCTSGSGTNGSGVAGSGANGCGSTENAAACVSGSENGSGNGGNSGNGGSRSGSGNDCGTSTPVVGKGQLPFTGFQAGLVALMGFALLGGGVGMRRLSRQRD